MGAAVAADAMVVGSRFIRLADSEYSDIAMTARQASDVLFELRCLLDHGGVFLPTATGTLTHAALAAIKGRLVILGEGTSKQQGAVVMDWPAPAAGKRHAPIKMAKEQGPQPAGDSDALQLS